MAIDVVLFHWFIEVFEDGYVGWWLVVDILGLVVGCWGGYLPGESSTIKG